MRILFLETKGEPQPSTHSIEQSSSQGGGSGRSVMQRDFLLSRKIIEGLRIVFN